MIIFINNKVNESCFLLYLLDNSNSNCFSHVSDSESTQWRIISKCFTTNRFTGFQDNHSRVIGLNNRWVLFKNSSGSSVYSSFNRVKSTSSVTSVAINNWTVSLVNTIWMIDDNNLSSKSFSLFRWIIICISDNISSFNVFNR